MKKHRHSLLAMLVLCSLATAALSWTSVSQAGSDPPAANAMGGGSSGPAPDSGEPDAGDGNRQRLQRNSWVPSVGDLRAKWQWWFGRSGIILITPYPWFQPIVVER